MLAQAFHYSVVQILDNTTLKDSQEGFPVKLSQGIIISATTPRMADEYGKLEAWDSLNVELTIMLVVSRSDALEAAASSFAATAEVAKNGRSRDLNQMLADPHPSQNRS
jgi:hypothetical protein